MNQSPQIASASTSVNADVPQLSLGVDTEKAEQLGFVSIEIFCRSGCIYRVYVQGEANVRDEPDDIAWLSLLNAGSETVPLAEFVEVPFATSAKSIPHFDLCRSVVVIARASPGVSAGQAQAAITAMIEEALPAGYDVGWTGAFYQ